MGFDALREVATGALRLLGILARERFEEAGRHAVAFMADSREAARKYEEAQREEETLTEWGDRALADFLAGNTEPLDPDNL